MQPLIINGFFLLLYCIVFEVIGQDILVPVSKQNGLTSTIVTATHVGSKGVVWIGTVNGLNACTGADWIPVKHINDHSTKRVQPLGNITDIFEDKHANIWVNSDQGLFLYNRKYWTFYEPETEVNYVVKEFFQDRSGMVWITEEYFQDFTSEMGFSLVSGKLQMYKEGRWFKFDEDVAGTVTVRFKDPESYFTAIYQDRSGRMWFTSLDGVFMFDGREWNNFSDSKVSEYKVFDICEDKRGAIWLATNTGVFRWLNDEMDTFNKKTGMPDEMISFITEDQHGNIWSVIGNNTRSKYLGKYNGANWTFYDESDIGLKCNIDNLFSYEDEFIAVSKDGVSVFKEESWKKFSKQDGLKDKNYSLKRSKRCNEIWLAADHGLYHLNEGKWDTKIDQPGKWKVLTLLHDSKDRLWVGTDKQGLFLLDQDKLSQYTDENGLSDNHVSEIFQDRHQNIWIVTKKGLVRFIQPESF